MRYKAFIVLQAEALELKGIKVFPEMWHALAIFPTKEDAMDYMANLIKTIKREQGIGWRTPDNLDPKAKLDFVVAECAIEVDDKAMSQRGWKLSGTQNERQ